jgi:sugar/nucleoside kinase (ribokinase family)
MPEPIDQIEFLIYGKIIIDHIRSSAGRIGSNVLGGGGPQAAFGARLWNDSIGLITRSGKDLSDDHIASLKQLNIDLEGWHGFDDIPTPQCLLQYNETEAIVNGRLISNHHDWANLLLMNLSLPRHYRNPRALHLITEFPHEEMALDALQMRKHGTIISLEPLIDPNDWDNRDSMLNLIRQVDIVTPDWQSASSIAN